MQVPAWMLAPVSTDPWRTSPALLAPTAGRCARRRRPFLRRALAGFARLLAGLLDQEALARQPGLGQAIEPRAKLLAVLAGLGTATSLRGMVPLAMLFLVLGLIAVLSRLPARLLLRAWAAAPWFSALIILPAALNLVTPGNPVLVLWRAAPPAHGAGAGPHLLAVTDAGLWLAARFVLRLLVCVTLVLLLTSTTPLPRLFRGLRGLGVPVLFVMLLGMMHRYLWVLARAAEELHLAKLSRTIIPGPARREQSWVAAGMGELFRRTRILAEQVYLAMIARGYTGEVYLLDEPRWQPRDWLALGSAVAFCLVLLAGDRL